MECSTSNIEHRTSNIQRPTSNVQRPTPKGFASTALNGRADYDYPPLPGSGVAGEQEHDVRMEPNEGSYL
jgi:hypothetical protein